jgi:hypothetical protein
MSMNFDLLKHRNIIFIETGTGRGDGVKKALRSLFKKIYSIELSEKRYEICKRRFKMEIQKGQVELFLGNSVNCLAQILKQVDSRATFWLDAHSGGPMTGSAKGDIGVPLIKELDLISRHHIKSHTILIDDVRLFGGKDREGVDWSNAPLDAVIKALKKINPDYIISYEKGHVPKDVLVAKISRFNWQNIL